MGKYGLQFWNKAGKLAHKFGIIKETDISILVMTCHCYDRLERAREVLGETLLGDGQFGEKKHPLLLIIQQEEDRLSKHLQQMGLTPVARERVTFSLPDKDNPFAEFINPSEDDVFAQLMASQGH